MKLIIQIPCYNEELTLPLVFADLPRTLPGISCIEYLIIDDGSTDRTSETAFSLGAHHVLRLHGPNRRRLGRTFQAGADYALQHGAQILVNTDGDNQYPSSEIFRLVRPIVEQQADLVIGDRGPWRCPHFSLGKRLLQLAGNAAIAGLARRPVADAVSGFRAYSRRALLACPVLTEYTYTVDTLLQAHRKGLRVVWLPIVVNPPTRPSRLARHPLEMVLRCGLSALRVAAAGFPPQPLSESSLSASARSSTE